jgi:hypothetical protein
MQDTYVKNSRRSRKRSQRRKILCPIHGTYLESTSQKYPMFADTAEQLQSRGVSARSARLLMATRTTVALDGEWLEAFWCGHCQQTEWYHVKKVSDRAYEVTPAPQALWQQVHGVIDQTGNPSVGEFTRTSAKMFGYKGLKGFQFVG